MKQKIFQKKNLFYLFLIISIGLFFFGLIVNFLHHYYFSSHILDIGLQGKVAKNSFSYLNFFSDTQNMNYLGDHFSPIAFLYGFLLFIFNSLYSFFVVQHLFFVATIFICFLIAKKVIQNTTIAILLCLLFSFNYFFHKVISYQVHIEVIAMPLLMLFFYGIEKKWKNLYLFSLLFILFLIKEDIPLVTFGIGIGLLITQKENKIRNFLIALFSIIAFFGIAKYLMPYFSDGIYTHLSRYKDLGDSPSEVIKNIFFKPDLVIGLLTEKHRLTTLGEIFIFTLFFPLFTRNIIFIFVPLFYNLIASYDGQYKLNFHYAYTVLPPLLYATIYGCKNFITFYKKIKQSHFFQSRQFLFLIKKIFLITLVTVIFILSIIKSIDPYARKLKHIAKLKYDPKEIHRDLKYIESNFLVNKQRIVSTGNVQPYLLNYPFSGSFSFSKLKKKITKRDLEKDLQENLQKKSQKDLKKNLNQNLKQNLKQISILQLFKTPWPNTKEDYQKNILWIEKKMSENKIKKIYKSKFFLVFE